MAGCLRALAVGAASGGRSSFGPAAVTLSGDGSAVGKLVASLGALGETVGDKLPNTPSRLRPRGLAPRVIGGASAGFALARRTGHSRVLYAVLAGGAALGFSYLGLAWREYAGRAGVPDVAAIIEDLAVAGLAAAAVAGSNQTAGD